MVKTQRSANTLQLPMNFQLHFSVTTTTHHNRFTGLFPWPPGSAGARIELLDFMVQGKINRGKQTDHPAGRHSIRTNQCLPPPSPHFFYRPDALPAAQPTVSKHWRQNFSVRNIEFFNQIELAFNQPRNSISVRQTTHSQRVDSTHTYTQCHSSIINVQRM